MNYLFDVDGTLTPPRQKMTEKFKEFFVKWCEGKDVYLVTGSDKDKTIEQIGEDLWSKLKVYQSCGNEYYQYGKLVKKNDHDFTTLKKLLKEIVEDSDWPDEFKCGNHIEERVGMINLSIIGRNANQKQRDEYEKWDNETGERKKYAETIKRIYSHWYDVSIGGQISLDIYPIGYDKSQVVHDLYGSIHFFGDKCSKGGNDYSIAQKLKSGIGHKVSNVRGPSHTMKLLKAL